MKMNNAVDQNFLFDSLGEIINRIEACGASIELTNVVSLASDLKSAIGNEWNQPNPYSFERVNEIVYGGERKPTAWEIFWDNRTTIYTSDADDIATAIKYNWSRNPLYARR